MTRALWLSLLLVASAAFAREKVRPKPNVSPVRQGTQTAPTPPPEPVVNPPDDSDDQAPPAVKDPDDDDSPPPSLFDDDDDSDSKTRGQGEDFAPKAKKKKSKEDEDRDAALGFGIMCCCFLFFVGIAVLIVWLIRRGGKPKVPPVVNYNTGPPQRQTPGSAGPFHLSVAAIALDARSRGMVDARFNALGGAGNAGAPPTKGAISRALAQALLEQRDHWRWFGYGEKPLMYAFGEADISFRAATDDFKARSNTAQSSPEGELVVYTLVCCANRLLKGVTRLDSIVEAQEVFLERSRVQDHEVFGGEVIASPLSGGMSEAELTQRYPEMNRLVSAVG